MSSWWENTEPRIFTVVKTRMKRNLTGYDIFYTTEGSLDAIAVFPTVYIQMLESPETAQDLSSGNINGTLLAFQVDVYTETKSECGTIIGEAVKQFKALGFGVMTMPVYSKEANIHRGIARFRRMVADGDSF